MMSGMIMLINGVNREMIELPLRHLSLILPKRDNTHGEVEIRVVS